MQYSTPKEINYETLRKCLDYFIPKKIYIRMMGSRGGTVKVDESLEGRTLDVQEAYDRWSFLINGKEVISLNNDARLGISFMYEIGEGIPIFTTDKTPDDPEFPEPQQTIMRYDLEWHLLEITFHGKIPIKPHSKIQGYQYWEVDTEKSQKQ